MGRALRAALAAMALACALPAGASIDAGAALAKSRAAIGSAPLEHAFTDSDGKRVTLTAYRGKPLIVSFVYTGCSQVCPVTTRRLAKAVGEARKVVGPAAFNVVSIGFNVPYDNPVSMRVFGRQQGLDDARWGLLTPDLGDVEALARDFGFAYAAQSGGFDHLAQVTILDARGRVHAQVYGEAFELPMLVQPLRELALGEPAPVASLVGYLERARLLCTVYDPRSGKYRLDYGLFIELGVGILCLGGTLGWLVRERLRARRP